MSYDPELEEKVRKRVKKKLKEREGLIIHSVTFITMNLVFWGIWLFTGGNYFPWPAIITMGWSIGMFAHFMDYYNNYGRGYDRREVLIQREIEKERARMYGYGYEDEKPKNDLVGIDDDGELIYYEDDEQNAQQSRG